MFLFLHLNFKLFKYLSSISFSFINYPTSFTPLGFYIKLGLLRYEPIFYMIKNLLNKK